MQSWFPGDNESLQSWIDERQERPGSNAYVRWFCGVDLGKRYDPSTVAIIEVQYQPRHYFVKYLKRFTLRMLYTDVATQLARINAGLKKEAARLGKRDSITWLLDSTGVGEPVAELVTTAMPLADIKKVYLTGGYNATTSPDDYNEIRLPKSQMVSTLVAAFDAKVIYLTKRSREIDSVIDELRNYEIKVSEEGRESYNAAPMKHDDLVCALGLAVWGAESDNYSGGPMIW
jgi:hypothetical protein